MLTAGMGLLMRWGLHICMFLEVLLFLTRCRAILECRK